MEEPPYELGDDWDEAFAPGGAPRPEAAASLAAVARHRPRALAAAVRRAVDDAGVGFSSVDGDGAFNLDPVPRAIAAAEWARLEEALGQRVKALDAFLADVYGRQ